jgi:lipid-A-disaccharide synthase-like uncharacterized protein
MRDIFIFSIGFIAQILFMSRMIVQWIRSEKAGRPLSPTLFWEMSILGALFFFLYAILRQDFAILLGQMIVYFIYLRNLYFKKIWSKMHLLIRWIFILLPFSLAGYLLSSSPGNWHDLVRDSSIPDWLIIWGSLGQVVFTLRFVVQWLESEKRNRSVLSNTFWAISLAGSIMILSYAILRKDPVLLVGQLTGSFLYTRNLMLAYKHKSKQKLQSDKPLNQNAS